MGASPVTPHGRHSRHPCMDPSVSVDCAEVAKVGQGQGQDGHKALLSMDTISNGLRGKQVSQGPGSQAQLY